MDSHAFVQKYAYEIAAISTIGTVIGVITACYFYYIQKRKEKINERNTKPKLKFIIFHQDKGYDFEQGYIAANFPENGGLFFPLTFSIKNNGSITMKDIELSVRLPYEVFPYSKKDQLTDLPYFKSGYLNKKDLFTDFDFTVKKEKEFNIVDHLIRDIKPGKLVSFDLPITLWVWDSNPFFVDFKLYHENIGYLTQRLQIHPINTKNISLNHFFTGKEANVIKYKNPLRNIWFRIKYVHKLYKVKRLVLITITDQMELENTTRPDLTVMRANKYNLEHGAELLEQFFIAHSRKHYYKKIIRLKPTKENITALLEKES